MKLSYYPGCSLEGGGREYDESMRSVFKTLAIDLEELKDWSCCGASSGHATDEFLALALPMRNLVIAEGAGLDLVIPCMACFNRLKHAEKDSSHNGDVSKPRNEEGREDLENHRAPS